MIAMTIKYGIKFSGPHRKNIWWMDYAKNRRMTFDTINQAYQWSDNCTIRFPHCQYIVTELPHGQKEKAQATQSS